MKLKIFYYIVLISNIIDTYFTQIDGTIIGDGEKIYTYDQSKGKTFLIKKEISSKKFFEITNFYGSYELLKGNTIIYNGEEKSEEYSYYFEYEDNFEYYLKFYKYGYSSAGFKIRSSDKQFNLILISSLQLTILKERTFEITIPKEESYPKFLCIIVKFITFNIELKNAYFKDIDGEFVPIQRKTRPYVDAQYTYYYYMILNDKITVNITLEANWYGTVITHTTDALITNSWNNIINITSYKVYCTNELNLAYYNIIFNSYSHYELDFDGTSKIYYFKSNNLDKNIQLKSNTIYDKSFNFIYADAMESKACFSIMLLNEKFYLINDSTYTLYLFNSRYYNITIKNTKAIFFRFEFQINQYFNLSRIDLINQNKSIDALIFHPNNYYVFQFDRDSNEIPIKIYFDKIKNYKGDYENITFKFKAFDADIDYFNIDKDYFECISSEKNFKLKQNSDNKPYLNFKKNGTAIVLNGAIPEDEKQIVIKHDTIYDLQVFGSEEYPTCIDIFYTEKEFIEVKKNYKYTFRVFGNFHYEFNLIDLKEERKIILRFDSKDENTNFSYINFEGTDIKDINNIQNHDNIEIIPMKNNVTIKLNVLNYNNLDEFTFYFILYSDYIFDIISNIFAYICFGLVIISYCIYRKRNIVGQECYMKEKFLSIFLCQNYDLSFLNKS